MDYISSNFPYIAWVDEAMWIKCIAQEHNPLAVVGLQLATFWFGILRCFIRPHVYIQ